MEEIEKTNTSEFDVEKVKNQLYEISYIQYIRNNENWISVMCKVADFGVLGALLLKIIERHDEVLITDVKLVEPNHNEVKS